MCYSENSVILTDVVKPNSKGQIIIPVKFRKKLNLTQDDNVVLTLNDKNEVILKVEKRPSYLSLAGSVKVVAEDNRSWEEIRQGHYDELAEKVSWEGKE